MDDPVTREEWQEAVDCAEAFIALESARLYGLVAGGPGVNVERCEEILAGGAARGIFPTPRAIEEFVKELASA